MITSASRTGVNSLVYVNDVLILEAANHVNDGVHLANVRKELISQTFALAGTLYQTCNIHEFNHRGGDLFGIVHLRKLVQTLVGNGNDTHVGVNGAEGVVCRLRTATGHRIKKRTFSHVGKSYNTKFHSIYFSYL